tara:strand:- start:134 stop:463 length:330 start_codon:yes stop_codon:yes gene_type:complete
MSGTWSSYSELPVSWTSRRGAHVEQKGGVVGGDGALGGQDWCRTRPLLGSALLTAYQTAADCVELLPKTPSEPPAQWMGSPCAVPLYDKLDPWQVLAPLPYPTHVLRHL